MAHKVLALLALLAVSSAEREQSRWSRQISSYTADISDWVPLPGPIEREFPQIKRQAVAEPRIMSEPFPGFARPTGFNQDSFSPRAFYNSPANRQLYLQSVPSAPQNYLTDQGFNQGLRFGLTQPNFPLSQGFVSPQFNFDGVPQIKPRPHISNPIKFETPKASAALPPPVKSFSNIAPKIKNEPPKFVDGYRVENSSDYNFSKRKPQSPQKIKFDNADKSREILSSPKTKVEREEVQLLYVPVESLNRGQFNFRSPISSAQLLNTELYNQNQRPNPLIQNIGGDFQRPISKPLETFNTQDYLNNFNSQLNAMLDPIPNFSTPSTPFPATSPTTPKPKKLKPHQPPLAIFLTPDAKKEDQVKVGDVLYSLKNADTVAVLDSVNPVNAPKVFIGPSSLTPPENYVKFELPYLSNIENIDKKLKQLPFFVAPLSYNTPHGFAKIPFPSPHVGSVVINSQIKDTPPATYNKATTTADINQSSFYTPSANRYEQKPVTHKPVVSYYSTSAPKANAPNYEQNYYSIEPQSVSTLRPFKEQNYKPVIEQAAPIKTGSYFLSNIGNQYNPSQHVNFPQDINYRAPEQVKPNNIYRPDTTTTTTPRTTISTTTKPPSTYPSQLLQTHNPFSINQAFHFSTPLDYHNFFDEYKEAYANPGSTSSLTSPTIPTNATPSPIANVESTEPQNNHQTQPRPSPNYLQNYTPEIHHESEIQNTRYSVYNNKDYATKIVETSPPTEITQVNNIGNSQESTQTLSNDKPSEYTENVETQPPVYENYTYITNNAPEITQEDVQSTKPSSSLDYQYDTKYDTSYNSQEIQSSSSSSSTTTTRRTPIRTRGRPRYPTTKSDSGEYSTRATVTRRPLRERKPLPPRSRYEPNKITTEKPTRKPTDSSESTTKSSRTRTRGRVHYKPSTDEVYERRKQNSKENDIAYQRDVLHQNYPVTLMERTSTVDIEAITEPSDKVISSNNLEGNKSEDTENAYSNDKVSISENINSESQHSTSVLNTQTEASYVPRVPDHSGEYTDQQKASPTIQDSEVSHDEARDEGYSIQTSPEYKTQTQETFPTNPSSAVTEQNIPNLSLNNEYYSIREEGQTSPEGETDTKIVSEEQGDNIVETTPSYNRVRVRPGVIRQYHQTSSTESPRVKTERRKTLQAITYRPAFDRRRTTMRIEEIEADLKTKQVHIRPEFQDYKQPVYKHEPSTEPPTTSSTSEPATKRGQFRRRRPTYTTTSTEVTATRRPYEIKNRFRGRRPTDKPSEQSEVQTDISTSTVKNNLYSRYSNRPRLSERFNKKPETEEVVTEDQESNFSIHRPKYAAPESDQWSPKFSNDSFKPYNPNDIADEIKSEPSERKLKNEDELDIITARNEFEDILISVTPATNTRVNKKIPDIPPTLEALMEQTKVTKSDTNDNMSTFESMLEEVMKGLEEQDENEYTNKVMKHKGGEIGEIPPERIISSGENYSLKSTTALQDEVATTPQPADSSLHAETEVESDRKNRRRGYWKKVKVRPVNEGIETAESQYYSNVVNRLGQTITKNSIGKSGKDNLKMSVTTYKPNYQFLKDFFESDEESVDVITNMEIPKLTTANTISNTESLKDNTHLFTTKFDIERPTERISPGDMDLGTGSPDPTFDDTAYYTDPTEPTLAVTNIDRSDGFSFMDYLFGVTSDSIEPIKNETITHSEEMKTTIKSTENNSIETETEPIKLKATTESTYVPDEITAETAHEEEITDRIDSEKVTSRDSSIERNDVTEKSVQVESSSISSYMDPANVVSTSMSTEISHETEICFRGKCIKTNKNVLL